MQLYALPLGTIRIPMISSSGGLYCTSLGLRSALGITKAELHRLFDEHRDEVSPLRAEDEQAQALFGFLRANKLEFGMHRLRSDMMIWSLRDAITIAALVNTAIGRDFSRRGITAMEEQMRSHAQSLSNADYERLVNRVSELENENGHLRSEKSQLVGVVMDLSKQVLHITGAVKDLSEEVSTLKKDRDAAREGAQEAARAASFALNAQKKTKAFRNSAN